MPQLPVVLLLANLAATIYMAGLIWFVQVVHYPLFAGVGEEAFPAYSRTHQQWNWVATSGTAIRASDGAEVDVALSMTQDQEEARPQVPSKKYGIWIDGALHKVPSLSFEYTILDEETRDTSDWTIASDAGDEDRVDLSFSPLAQRHDETGYLWFYYTNYNLYVGQLSGTITLDGETYTIDDLTTVTEDSTLTL